eukprot:1161909-Pelagomonas_calceolata.AAC.12
MKAVEIIEGITDDRNARRAAKGQPMLENSTAWAVGEDGKLHHKMDSAGNDSDWDSVELMVCCCSCCCCLCRWGGPVPGWHSDSWVGMETDGGPGLGWHDDSGDTSEYPYDGALVSRFLPGLGWHDGSECLSGG